MMYAYTTGVGGTGGRYEYVYRATGGWVNSSGETRFPA